MIQVIQNRFQDTVLDAKSDMGIADPPYKMTPRGRSRTPTIMPHNGGENIFKGKLPVTSEWMKYYYENLKVVSWST